MTDSRQPSVKQDEQRHADDRDAHVQQQFVGFLRRGFAVVARDRDLDIARNERALERLDLSQHLVRRRRWRSRPAAWRCSA